MEPHNIPARPRPTPRRGAADSNHSDNNGSRPAAVGPAQLLKLGRYAHFELKAIEVDGKRWGEKARPLIVGALAGLGPLIDAEVDPRKDR